MGDDERSKQPSDIDIWERLLLEQTELFKKTTETNKVLQSRVQELERELSVWKLALKTADDEKDGLRKEVSRLQRNIGSFTEDNPLILCLVDGDGNIFAPNLIAAGRAGGRHAAMLITQGITEHIATLDNDGSSGRAQIWLTIYCNKKGLSETLTSNNVCTAEQFDEFFMGFNQANPLFSFVDAGVGKEAADSKIKEYLRVFTRFPQTSRVFFGGGHDNGYTSTLNQLQNEGLHNKITILRGYKDLAFEPKSLGLPHLEIEGVFMTNKLQNPVKKSSPAAAQNIENVIKKVNNATEGIAANPNMRQRENNMNSFNGSYGAPGQPGGIRMLNPNLKLHQHKPPPCNFFYLTSCAHGDRCRYAHNYVLNPERLEELRANSRKWPCPYVNNGKPCPFGEDYCCMAHRCPHGPKCLYAKQNKCKFATSMHGNVLPIVESSDGPSSPLHDEASFSPSQSTPSYTLLSLSPTPSPRKKGKGSKASGSGSNSSTKHSTPQALCNINGVVSD